MQSLKRRQEAPTLRACSERSGGWLLQPTQLHLQQTSKQSIVDGLVAFSDLLALPAKDSRSNHLGCESACCFSAHSADRRCPSSSPPPPDVPSSQDMRRDLSCFHATFAPH
ncbi:hypothetical protein AMECASPLE_015683 [Ameca splendens]|uniref:Uncharacterized protein n=1 Tax=Ameca splendens TaxID=208324 RepID=A0ABV0XF38_9TELE